MVARCAPDVSPITITALIDTESARNPYAVANVSDGESKSFKSRGTALAYVNNLERLGKTYSAGLMQIYSKNFKSYGLTNESVFDSCENLKAGSKILIENYSKQSGDNVQKNIRNALSRFYSGNDERGYVREYKVDGKSYVQRVEEKAYKVPALKPLDQSEENENEPGNELIVGNKSGDINKSSSWDVFGDFK